MLETKWFKRTYWLFVGMLGLMFVFFMPPFQKNDEMAHFYRAMSVARGELFCKKIAPDIPYSFFIMDKFYQLPYFLHADRIMFNYSQKFPISLYKDVDFSDLKKLSGVKYIGLCSFNFLGYVPNVFGLSLGFLTKNYILMFFSGRLFGFLFFLSCLFISIKLVDKKYRNILYFYGIIPMVLHQASAISYDVMLLSLVPLIFSLLTRLCFDRLVNKKFWWILLFVLSLLLFSREGFPFITFLCLLVPWKKIDKKFWKYLLIVGLFLGINYLGYRALGTYNVKTGVNPEPNALFSSVLQRENLLTNPIYIVKALVNAFYYNGGYYIRELIGIFGSRDTPIVSDYLHYLYIALAGLILWLQLNNVDGKDDKKLSFGWLRILILFVIIGLTVMSIFCGFYLGYATVGQTEIKMVQGRYFLAIVPFLFLLMNQIFKRIGKESSKKIVLTIFCIFILGNVFQSIYLRFYDYSTFYSNKDEMKNNLQELSNDKAKKIEYMTVDKSVNLLIPGVQNKKIGGFELLINTDGKLIYIPYEYQLLDLDCTRVLKKGFLKQVKLVDGIYSEDFGKTKLDGGVCLKLTPIGDVSALKKINYLKVASEPIVLKYIWD